jgi:hypothetical protein
MIYDLLRKLFSSKIVRYFYRFSFKATKHFGNHGISILILFAITQRLHGITSLIPNSGGKHIILVDVENCTLEQVIEESKYVQRKYGLSNIYIKSDVENSFRVWCFSIVDFKTLLKILLDFEHLDMVFLIYTVRRKKATLRDVEKDGRPPEKVVAILESYPMPVPEHIEEVFYDTGVVKQGSVISLGDDD